MSFYPQPNLYQCGPFALKHALVMLGVFKNEDEIGIAAGSTWWAGTDEMGLSKAAKKYNCRMKYFQSSNPDDARRALNKELQKGFPCVLSVNDWGHWLTVVNYTRGRYVVIDSSEDDKVISISTPQQILRKWRYKDPDEGIISYDGYAVHPNFKTYTRAKFKLDMAKKLMYKENDKLAKKWDQYFNDLISVCKPRTKLTTYFITFSEFLRRNEKNLVTRVANWHGMPSYSEIKKILYNMKFVAEVYDLIIPIDLEKKALIDISSLLMMYSCGKYGMDPLY